MFKLKIMNRKYILTFYLALIINLVMSNVHVEDNLIKFHQISNSCSSFSSSFYQILSSQQTQENVISSPFSAYVILSVLHYGAAEATMEEFKTALHFLNPNEMRKEFKYLLTHINNTQKCEFDVVSSIYADESFELNRNFLIDSKQFFGIHIEHMNFKYAADSARQINELIKQKTRGKIVNIINSSDINEFTKLILINALYFKSSWLNPFHSEFTENKIFYNINNIETITPMMFKKLHIPHGYIESLDCSFIKLKYLDEQFEMIILLPNEKYGLYELEHKFNWNLVLNADSFSNDVELFLPKFKIDSTIDLKVPLKNLGINLAFEEEANFSLLSDKPLYVDKVIQKVMVEVDEKGSEATAATVAHIRSRRMITDTINFVTDHPFMFIIHHVPSSIPLFIGSIRQLGEIKIKEEL